jgi:hypothetical protein
MAPAPHPHPRPCGFAQVYKEKKTAAKAASDQAQELVDNLEHLISHASAKIRGRLYEDLTTAIGDLSKSKEKEAKAHRQWWNWKHHSHCCH